MKLSLEAFFYATRLTRPCGAEHPPDHRPLYHSSANGHQDMGPSDAVTEFCKLTFDDQIEIRTLMGASFNGLEMKLKAAGFWNEFAAAYEQRVVEQRVVRDRTDSALKAGVMNGAGLGSATFNGDDKADRDVTS